MRMIPVFIDTEFTGLHAYTTLISIGLVSWSGESLYLCLNDYDKTQVTPWVAENVLPHLRDEPKISSKIACERLEEFFMRIGGGNDITLISAGKMNDHLLLFQLWHACHPEMKNFHFSKIPQYLYHDRHLDLHTLFVCAGYDPNSIVDRAAFANYDAKAVRHNALDDALVVRACVQKILRDGKLPELAKMIS